MTENRTSAAVRELPNTFYSREEEQAIRQKYFAMEKALERIANTPEAEPEIVTKYASIAYAKEALALDPFPAEA